MLACIRRAVPMSQPLKPASLREAKVAICPGIFPVHFLARFSRLLFIEGPRLFFTSPLSGRKASMMVLLCAPPLLFCMMVTLPGLLFQSPQQQAYFYFSQVLNNDPSRWVGIVLAGCCAVLALAVPVASTKATNKR